MHFACSELGHVTVQRNWFLLFCCNPDSLPRLALHFNFLSAKWTYGTKFTLTLKWDLSDAHFIWASILAGILSLSGLRTWWSPLSRSSVFSSGVRRNPPTQDSLLHAPLLFFPISLVSSKEVDATSGKIGTSTTRSRYCAPHVGSCSEHPSVFQML
jgi:hypothetical protein